MIEACLVRGELGDADAQRRLEWCAKADQYAHKVDRLDGQIVTRTVLGQCAIGVLRVTADECGISGQMSCGEKKRVPIAVAPKFDRGW